jgi:hypothetical protein
MRARAIVAGLFVVGGLGAGCVETPPAVHPVVKQAQFDLNCPRSELRYMKLDEKTIGVTGCGGRAKYVALCRTTNPGTIAASDECQWVRD